MQLYNTLTRKTETIAPLNAPKVTVYTCGPTVYDYMHVGNWFTFIRYDLLVRALKASGLEPVWVMNITDVGHLVSDADEGEDKLEKGARREGKTAWDVAAFYSDYFIKGLERLNITTPAYLPRATEHIPEQIDLIKHLEEKGFTYSINDGVYYDTAKFPKYGDFARLDIDEQQAGARVEYNQEKRNPTDFALWKFSPKDQKRDMEWDSPWGKGFPGWHLECSAMSMKYLGETIDIHAGGIDHIPVHHTNEIAQSEAVTGKPLANYWMHTNHITVNGEKIAKSLNNGITLEDIASRDISLEAFRLHVLESHYRSQSRFSWESLEGAQNRLSGIRNNFSWIYQTVHTATPSQEIIGLLADYKKKILAALQDDLNTPSALSYLNELADRFATVIASEQDISQVEAFAADMQALLGINILDDYTLPAELQQLVTQRQKAREAQDWAKSDELRQQLAAGGIGVRDTPQGPIWFRL